MPTIEEAIREGLVVKIGGNLQHRQLPNRLLLATREVVEWMKRELPQAKTDGYTVGAATPKEQLAVLFNQFVAGNEIGWPVPHEMRPNELGIYRLRTDDVRLNGWFPRPKCFVIGSIDFKSNCSGMRDNQLRDEAKRQRELLGLEGGQFLLGDYHGHL